MLFFFSKVKDFICVFFSSSTDRCTMPLGAEDRRLVPGSFSASSYYTGSLAPWYARLNQVYSWSTRYNRAGQWLQVSLGGSSTIKGVATQGRSNANQWVKSYTLSYSVDDYRFVAYREGSTTRVIMIIIYNNYKNDNTFTRISVET